MPDHFRLLIRAVLVRALLLAVVWWALAGADGALFAAAFVALAVGISLMFAPPRQGVLSLAGILRFVPFFLWASLRGGIDVARRAFDPRLRIAPALCDYRLRVTEERERVMVAAVLSLMPGSVSARLERDRVRLHVLDERLPIERTLREVETHVAAVFGHRLNEDVGGGRGR